MTADDAAESEVAYRSKFADGAPKACAICKSHRLEICATAQQK